MPGGSCMAGTTIRQGPSPLGAGGCGGGWHPSPPGCTAALSTVGDCAMLPTASMRWPGGDAEPPCTASWVSPAVPFPGTPLWVPRVKQRPSWGPGGAWEGHWGSAETFIGCWGAQEGPWETLGGDRALQGVLGGSGKPQGDHHSHIQLAFYPVTVRDPKTSPRSLSHTHSKKVSSNITLYLGLCHAPLVLSLPLLRFHLGGPPTAKSSPD